MKYTRLFILLGIFHSAALFAQPTQETIYIQTDQPGYLAGTGINVKAWIFLGNQARREFTNLYVDLLNDQRETVASTILPAWRGQASGGLAIPVNLDESVYYLHAYTVDTRNLFGKHGHIIPVPVLNPKSRQKLVRDTALRWTASVHVEGGQLLAEQPTRVVVHMHAETPFAFGWHAEVRNGAGKVVATLHEKDDNIAFGWLTPAFGETYIADIKDQHGVEMSIPLPVVTDTGAFFQVNVGLNAVRYGVLLRGEIQSRGPFTIRGTQHGQVVYSALLAKGRMEAAGAIPVDSLNRGTVYLELLDAGGRLLSDRLCYVHVQDSLPPLLFDSLYTPAGSKAMQVFKVRAIEGLPWAFAYAREADDTVIEEQENLYSRLYLSSISGGQFIRPARYFEGDSLLHLLDALYMSLTADFRNHLPQFSSSTHRVKDSLLSFRGMAYGRSGPLVNQDINLVIKTGEQPSSIQQVTTDNKGQFMLENLYFTDSAVVFYQINGAKDRNKNDIVISLTPIQRPARQPVPLPYSGWVLSQMPGEMKAAYPSDRIVQAMNTEQAIDRKVKVLDEVRITAQKKSKTRALDEELSSGLFRSGDVSTVDLVNDYPEAAGFTNIFSFLQGKFPSLQFALQNGEYVPIYRGTGIFIAIDEVPSQVSLANLLIPANIAMVKLQRYNFLLGGPVLAIYTRRGVMASGNSDNVQGLNQVTIQGYGKEIPRPKVDYRSMESGSTVQDQRITLYWNHLYADSDKGFLETIRFFRNDSGKRYRLTVVGILDNGLPLQVIDRVY